MKSNILYGALYGLPIGLTIAWYWFNTWDWYHDYVVNAWTNPYVWVFGGLTGVAIAIYEDSRK